MLSAAERKARRATRRGEAPLAARLLMRRVPRRARTESRKPRTFRRAGVGRQRLPRVCCRGSEEWHLPLRRVMRLCNRHNPY